MANTTPREQLGLITNTGGQAGSNYRVCLICGQTDWRGTLVHKPGCAKITRQIQQLRQQ